MAFTAQQTIDRARLDLADTAKVRFSDDDLLGWLNDFLALARGVRPDLFFGHYDEAEEEIEAGDDFPLPQRYRVSAAHYIVSRAEMGDDEHLNSGRVKACNDLFKAVLTDT